MYCFIKKRKMGKHRFLFPVGWFEEIWFCWQIFVMLPPSLSTTCSIFINSCFFIFHFTFNQSYIFLFLS